MAKVLALEPGQGDQTTRSREYSTSIGRRTRERGEGEGLKRRCPRGNLLMGMMNFREETSRLAVGRRGGSIEGADVLVEICLINE